jgi:hypothetical protein
LEWPLVEEVLTALVWRLTWWLVRILWLPFLIFAFIGYVVLPALAELAQLLISPGGLLVVALLLVWLAMPGGRRHRHG